MKGAATRARHSPHRSRSEMTGSADHEGLMKKILVVQTWGIGDMIMTTPMLRSLRNGAPGSRVTVLAGNEQAASVVRGSPLCDEVRVAEIGSLGLGGVGRLFLSLRSERFDAAIMGTRISPRIAQLLRLLSGIPVVAGDSESSAFFGYTQWRPASHKEHRVHANLKILQLILPRTTGGSLYFQLNSHSREEAERIWRERHLSGNPVVALHPGSGARQVDKRIPIETCRSVIRQLCADNASIRILLVIGPDESGLADKFAEFGERVVVVQNYPIGMVAALIAKSAVMVAGDSGMGHVAAAFGVPVVTLAGPTEVFSTRPWGEGHVVLKTTEFLSCMPCYSTPYYGRCPFNQKCMMGIDPESVVSAIEPMIAGAKK